MKRGFAFSIIASLILCAQALAYDWSTNPGNGSPENPYQISTPEQLMSIGDDSILLTKHYILTDDIIFDPNNNPAHVFDNSLISFGTRPGFTGFFDGSSYAIRNLKIVSSVQYLGLFGTATDAVIKNIRMENTIIVSNSEFVGGLIGQMLTTEVKNCSVSGQITGSISVGGLVGRGELSYWSFTEGDVEIPGGIIRNCSSEATVTGQSDIGGLVGYFAGKISRCSSTATVEGTMWIGGLVSYHDYCESADENMMSQCSSRSQVYGNDNSRFVGDLAGGLSVPVYDSYSNGMVTVGDNSQNVGGFAGTMSSSGLNPGGSAINCYSAASISAGEGGTNIGAFSGYSGWFENCYFLDTAGPDNGYGTPLDDPNMMIQANFVGWDFLEESTNDENEIWRMCVDGVDYPRLSLEFAQNGDFACGDGTNILDLQSLAEEWLTTTDIAPTTFNYACDANVDEQINLSDYAALAENW